MKWTNVVLLALTGMVVSGTGAYVVTPPGGYVGAPEVGPERPTREAGLPEGPFEGAHFSSGSTLRVEGRVGNERLAPGQSTFLLVELKGDEAAPAARSPVDLSLVIDKSGSMRGERLRHAIDAASGSVQRLADGDSVAVLAFDERVQTVVPPTVIDAASRARVLGALHTINVGGNTCLSCGVELGLGLAGGAPGRVAKMVVLSDGEANRGVRDVPGFRTMAARARERSVAITTVGVDVSYNEQALSALAFESNGRHYFVENDAALPRVFEGEAQAATSALASGVEASITLAPGVELERVFDRTFSRSGRQVTVPLGAFTRGETKTVLVQVRAPAGGGAGAALALADVDVTYHDQTTRSPGVCRGSLASRRARDAAEAAGADPIVLGRVERSETASSLVKAGELFAKGRGDEASKLLEGRTSKLKAERARASAAPAAAAGVVARAQADLDRQERAVADASREFGSARSAAEAPPATAGDPLGGAIAGPARKPSPASGGASPPPPPAPQQTRQGQTAVKRNVDRAVDLNF